MLLQSHRSFDTLAKFDRDTGVFTTFSKSDDFGRQLTNMKDGIFDYLDGRRVILYRHGTELIVQVDEHRINVNRIVIDVIPTPVGQCLRFHSSGQLIASIQYQPSKQLTIDDDPTAFAEAEDFDFGLFLANVASDRPRQERMFTEH